MGRRIGDILIEERLITPAQRDEALRQQKSYGGRIGTNLVELGAIELEALTRALARQKGVPAALQRHFESIHREAVGLVPAQLAQKHCAIPLGFTSYNPKTLAVAFLDPAKPGAIDEIQFAANARIYPVIAPELRIFLYLEKLYGIPRQVRFLRTERPNPDAPGRWQPASGPVLQAAPGFLSPPELTPPGSIPASNPQVFFDMTRPDLSQPRTRSAILLTEAVPSDASAPARPESTAQATAQPRTTPSASGKSSSQSQGSLGTAAVSAKTASAGAAAKAGAGEASSGPRAQPPTAPAAAVPVLQADSPARRPRREGTPPPLPVSDSRSRSQSRTSQSAKPGAPRGVAPATSSSPGSPSPQLQSVVPSAAPRAKPKPPTPTPDPVAQGADKSDARSRAPTIPDIPAFAIDLETPPHSAPTSQSAGSDDAKASAPTIKIDFDLDDEPLPQTAPTAPAATVRRTPGSEPESMSEGAPSAATSPPSLAEPAASAPASKIHAEFASLPIDELWGEPSASPVEAATTDEPGAVSAPDKSRELRHDAAPKSLRSPTATRAEVNRERLVTASPEIEPALIGPTGQMADSATEVASIASGAPAPGSAESKKSPEPAPRPWSATEAVDAMAVASNRDQIADAIVNYLRSNCGVGLVMIVQHEVAMGWKGFAPGLDDEAIGSLGLPLAAPSILQIAYRRQTTFSGAPPAEGAQLDHHFWKVLRSPAPKEAIVAPIVLRDRVVNLIYGHAADGGPLPDRALVQIGMLCRAAAAAYVRLIQSAKAKSES